MTVVKYKKSPIDTFNGTSYSASNIVLPNLSAENYINKEKLFTYYSANYNINEKEEYRKVLPSNLDLFSRSKLKLDRIVNSDTKENLLIVLNEILKTLATKNEKGNIQNVFPKFEFSYLEDESIIIEWIFKTFRAGFTIEPSFNDSATYLVIDDDEKGQFQSSSQLMDKDNYKILINEVIDYVVRNA